MSFDPPPPEKTPEEIEAEEKVKTDEFNAKLKCPYIRIYQRRRSNGTIIKEYMGYQCEDNWRKSVERIAGPGWNNNAKIAIKRFGKARTDMTDGSYWDFRLIRKPEDVPET